MASSLAPEILSEIFLACIPALDDNDLPAYFPYCVSHVCHHWRTTALGFPKLWSFLDVEQTQENQECDSEELFILKAYLERSRQHPLTFRLACSYETLHYQTLLVCLEEHMARWQNVYLQSPDEYTLQHLEYGDPSDYPMLRTLVCTDCRFDSDAASAYDSEGSVLHSIPWAQLKQYHEIQVSWSPDCGRQWEIMSQLTNVVDLRASFYAKCQNEEAIEMPHLRFASLTIDENKDKLKIEDIINCFHFPGIQGLNLKLTDTCPMGALSPVPDQLKRLKILRLCGSLKAISNDALLGILTEIQGLTDLAMELRQIDITYLFTLLTPNNSESVLIPHLRALRTTAFIPVADGELDALLEMLRQRFGKVYRGRLERFEFLLGESPRVELDASASTMFYKLEELKTTEGWDIRVDKEWQRYDFWGAEMDGEFL